jgi:hypothetical protein
MIHIEPMASAFYVYADGDSYEFGDEPQAIGSLCRTGSKRMEVMATKGELTRKDLRDLARELKEKGVRVIEVKRVRPHRVPLGKLVRSEGPFDIYEIDTAAVC